MLENLYTTKMSGDAKKLQRRFSKIRSKSGRAAKLTAFLMSAVIAATMLCATVVMAAVANEEKNFFIDGKGYAITPVLVENSLAAHTDSYYVPLRETFEALGYGVKYDADKSKYDIDRYTFPAYDYERYDEFYDEESGELIVIDYNGYEWQKPLVTNEVDYYIYGATQRLNAQLPVIEMTKDGKTETCQIGSFYHTTGYAPPTTLINGRAYIPLRAVANIVGGIDNVKWNDEKHDTYYEGALTFDEATMTVTINTQK